MIPRTLPLADLPIATRTLAALRNAGKVTFGDVVDLNVDQLLALPNFSPLCLEDLCGATAAQLKAGQVVSFMSRAERLRRAQETADWYSAEVQRCADAWSAALSGWELATARLEALVAEGGA